MESSQTIARFSLSDGKEERFLLVKLHLKNRNVLLHLLAGMLARVITVLVRRMSY